MNEEWWTKRPHRDEPVEIHELAPQAGSACLWNIEPQRLVPLEKGRIGLVLKTAMRRRFCRNPYPPCGCLSGRNTDSAMGVCVGKAYIPYLWLIIVNHRVPRKWPFAQTGTHPAYINAYPTTVSSP